MNKLEEIKNAIERDHQLAFPHTSERRMKTTKGSPEFIREQFIDSVKTYFDKNQDMSPSELQKEDANKFQQILKKIYEKYEEIISEIQDHMDDTEERILRMAKEDYVYKKMDLDDDEDEEDAIEDVDFYDVQDIVAEFIPEEFHHNIRGRYPWAEDYFPQSIDPRSIEDHEPWGSFMSKYVDPISNQLDVIYRDFLGLDKKVQDNIRKNYQNMFDFIFEEVPRLNWDFIRQTY